MSVGIKSKVMEENKKMTDEEIQKDGNRMAEILYQICALAGYNFQQLMTVCVYGLIDLVLIIARQSNRNPDEELKIFAAYINKICEEYDKAKTEQSNAS